MAEFVNPHEENFTDEELLLQEIQDQCACFADELITLVCKRAIRTINSWPYYVMGSENYPSKFTTFDIFCCEHQSKSWNEISPLLEGAIDGAISNAYDSLSPKDKFFIEYSECYYNTRFLDSDEINKLLIRYVSGHNQASNRDHLLQSRHIACIHGSVLRRWQKHMPQSIPAENVSYDRSSRKGWKRCCQDYPAQLLSENGAKNVVAPMDNLAELSSMPATILGKTDVPFYASARMLIQKIV